MRYCFYFLISVFSVFAQTPVKRHIIVGINNNFPPYEFVDRNGIPTGYDVELIQAVAEIANIEIEIRAGAWNDVRSAVEQGKYNALAGMLYSQERSEKVFFSTPHLIINYSIFAHSNVQDITSVESLRNKTVLVERGSLMHDYLQSLQYTDSLILVESEPQALQRLATEKYDCALVPHVQGLLLIQKNKYPNITPVVQNIFSTKLCFAVSRQDTSLLALLNDGLAVVKKTGKYNEIYEKWFNETAPHITFVIVMKYILVVVVPLLLLLFLIVVWNRLLKHKVQLQTKALAQSEERYRVFFEQANDGIFVLNKEGNFLDVNPCFCSSLGYSREELLKCSIASLFPPEELKKNSIQSDKVLRGENVMTQCSVVKKDGSLIDVELNMKLQSDGDIHGIARDITFRRRMEQDRISYSLKLQGIMESTQDIVFALDTTMHYTAFNENHFKAMKAIYGIDIEIGKNIIEYMKVNGDDGTAYSDILRALHGEQYSIEQAYGNEKLYRTYFEASYNPIRESDGTITGVAVFVRDVSERRQNEERLKEAKKIEETFLQLGRQLSSAITPFDAAKVIVEAADALIGFDVCVVELHLPDEDQMLVLLQMDIINGTRTQLVSDRMKWNVTARIRRTMNGNGELILRTPTSIIEKDFKPFGDTARRSASLIFIPIRRLGKSIGVLSIQSYTYNAYTKDHLTTLQALADHCSGALERIRTEAELQENQRMLSVLIGNLPGMVYRTLNDGKGTIQFVSDGCFELTGYTAKELIGTSAYTITLPEDVPLVRDVVRNAIPSQQALQLSYRLRKKDGSIRWVSEYGNFVYGTDHSVIAIEGFLIDTTDRKESEERYKELFEESRDGIFISTPEGNYVDVNPAFITMMGYASKEEVLKLDIARDVYCNEDDRKKFVSMINRQGFVENFALRVKKKNGDLISIETTATLVRSNDGSVVAIRGIMRDVTERIQLQQQLVNAQKLEGLGTLAGGIAHEFNNLLAMVLGNAEIIKQKNPENASTNKYLSHIIEATHRGASIAKQLLLFSRPHEISFKAMSLVDVIGEVHEMLHYLLPKSITVNISLGVDDGIIMGDAEHVQQIIVNLAVNAKDAMGEVGTMSIAVNNVSRELMQTKFPASGAKPYLCISVSDSGTGIDEKIRQRIFEPFFTTKELGKGTGLGLSIVHGIVQSHQGFIDVQSEIGKGTTFYIYFPLITTTVDVQEKTNIKKYTHATILFVDDEKMLREMMVEILEEAGHTVFPAVDGYDALETYTKHKDKITLVISDLGMPKMGGKQLFNKLYDIDNNVKVIVASGYLEATTKSDMLTMGVKDVIAKPYRAQTVLNTIERVLNG